MTTTFAYILCGIFFIFGIILGIAMVKSPVIIGVLHVNKTDASKDLISLEFTSDEFLECNDGDLVSFRVENGSFNETRN